MDKLLILLFSLAISVTTMADDYTTLTFVSSDGSQTSVAASGLCITFADGQLVGENGNSSITLDLGQLQKMYFGQATGIVAAATADDGSSEATLYTLGGVKVGTFGTLDEARSQLRPGVYIVKTSNKTFKTTIK